MTSLLIVDDKQQDLYMLQVLLSAHGFQVETALNGAEALELARRAPPEMIVSDILMPVMDGFALCRAWKKDARLKNIPFVFYTATYTDPKDEDFALSLGAERFIVKPLEPDAVVAIIREVIATHAKGKLVAPREPIAEEAEYYKKYNAALVRKLEDKVLQLKRANQRLTALYQVSNGLAALKPPGELVLLALRAIVETVGFQEANYFHYDENQGKLYLLDAVGFPDEVLAAFKERLVFALGEEQGLVGLVAQTRQPLIVAETTSEPRWITLDETIHSALFVPVLYENRLLGVAAILSREAGAFDQADAHNITTLANNLAIAIENTQLLERVQRSELYYRTILESSADAIMSVDPDLKIAVWNSGAERIFGYTKEAVIGQPRDILIPPQEKTSAEELLGAAREKGFVRDFQTQRRAKDGRLIDVEMTMTYLGPKLGYTAVLRDITERKRAEEQLAYQAYLLANVNDAVIASDESSVLTSWNRAAEMIFGWKTDEVLGRPYQEVVPTEFVGVEQAEVTRALTQSGQFRGEMIQYRKDGQPINIETTITTLRDKAGKITGFVGVNRDITERKRAEEALRQLNAVLEQRVEERTKELSLANLDLTRAVRLKDEFLANMSHELRTPLTAILGMSESLREGTYGSLNERQTHSVQIIESSGRHLLALITDILDLSKIGAGTLDVQLGPVLVASVCQASLRFVQQAAHKKHLTLTSQLDEQVSVLQADERRLKQILVNLLANAVKFTPEGGAVGLEVVGDIERGEARFTVWDTGIGIAPEDIARLFQPFTQLDTGLARRYEGAGLGLALVVRLVELHGGRVWVESELGHGSRFSVAIPWRAGDEETRRQGDKERGRHTQADPERADAEPPRPARCAPRPAGTILLAEDNPMAFEVVAEYLTEKGYRVITASNGAEALERARAEQPALILMDAQMPVMDGLEATRRLRADAELKHIPIIALTGLAMEGDEARCLEAGANDYVSKPVSLKKLLGAVEAQLKR